MDVLVAGELPVSVVIADDDPGAAVLDLLHGVVSACRIPLTSTGRVVTEWIHLMPFYVVPSSSSWTSKCSATTYIVVLMMMVIGVYWPVGLDGMPPLPFSSTKLQLIGVSRMAFSSRLLPPGVPPMSPECI